MTVLFPKWTNKVPAFLALGAGVAGLCAVLVVTFWFSPRHTDVGYQPYQPISYSHKLHAGSLGMDCRYCHRHHYCYHHYHIQCDRSRCNINNY